MKTRLRRKRRVLFAGLAVAAISAGVLGFLFSAVPRPVELPPELSIEALEADWDSPARLRRNVFEAMQRERLTPRQWRQFRSNVACVWEARLNRRVDQYFSAPPAERQAVLDRHLDALQRRREEAKLANTDLPQHQAAESIREARVPTNHPVSSGAGVAAAPGAPSDLRGDVQFPPRSTRQQRKLCSESRDPDQVARWLAYADALSERAKERGMQLPSSGLRRGAGNSR